jgi:predicted nucleotidyltransferase
VTNDPNIERVEVVAAALGELREQLVLVGGCAVSLLIDSAIAAPPRVTYDVDLIAEVTALRDYHALEELFAQRGFMRDMSPDAPICRWTIGVVKVDLVPSSDKVLGFSNSWYKEAILSARPYTLPTGVSIHVISAAAFLATKFEAFDTRGRGDMVMSHDFEDIINILEGCQTVVEDIQSASPKLNAHLVGRFSSLTRNERFHDTLPGLIAQDELHHQRIARVLSRLASIAST